MNASQKTEVVEEAATLRKTYTVEEAGKALGLSRNGAYDAARRGEIPSIRIGKRILIPRGAFDRMLEGKGL